jgi:flagellar biosynthesis protein FlhF
LIKLFAENRDKDFIFIDTTGRSPVMKEHIYEIGRLFDAVPGLEAKAFLCANYKAEDLEQLIKLYRKLPVNGWIISKTDETRNHSPLFLPLLGYQVPVSHITTGQRVPEDIKEADKKTLVKMLFPDKHTKIYTPFIQGKMRSKNAQGGTTVNYVKTMEQL